MDGNFSSCEDVSLRGPIQTVSSHIHIHTPLPAMQWRRAVYILIPYGSFSNLPAAAGVVSEKIPNYGLLSH
eukprot:6187038-Pleurochrysis_carterae.AAC.7